MKYRKGKNPEKSGQSCVKGDLFSVKGSCGSSGGSVGIIETCDNTIAACYLVKQAELEELV